MVNKEITVSIANTLINVTTAVPENATEYDTLAATSCYDYAMSDKETVFAKKVTEATAKALETACGNARKFDEKKPRQRGEGFVFEGLEKADIYIARVLTEGSITVASLEEITTEASKGIKFADILAVKRSASDGLGKASKEATALAKAKEMEGKLDTLVNVLLDKANKFDVSVSDVVADALELLDSEDETFLRAFSKVFADVNAAIKANAWNC